jgi:glycosyltransferase involved in cell wall biosynthesis
MKIRPVNCNIWGERNDVDRFYAAMDVLLFTSTSELSPLVPREALAWGMPVLMRNLPIYQGAFACSGVHFINGDLSETVEVVAETLRISEERDALVST